MKTISATIRKLALVTAVLTAAQGQAAPIGKDSAELLAAIPPESALCLIVNDLETNLANLKQYLSSFAPPQAGANLNLDLAGNMLGNPALEGFDLSRPLGAFVQFKTDRLSEPAVAWKDVAVVYILLPISNFDTVTAKSAAITAGEKGLATLQFGSSQARMISLGRHALLSPTADAAALLEQGRAIRASKGLQPVLGSADIQDLQKSSVWLRSDVRGINPFLQAKLTAAFTAIQQNLSSAMAASDETSPAAMGETVIRLYRLMAEKILAETESASLGLVISPAAIALTNSLKSMPESDLEKIFVGTGKTVRDSRYIGQLQDGAVMNMAMVYNPASLQKTYDILFDLLGQSGFMQTQTERFSKIRQLSRDFFAASGSSLAMTMLPGDSAPPLFNIRYFCAVSDPASMDRILTKTAAMTNSGMFTDLYKNVGIDMDMSMKRHADRYRTISIDNWELTIKARDNMPDEALRMMDAIYGGDIKGATALVDNTLCYVFAGDADQEIRQQIDNLQKSGKAPNSEVKSALQLLPEHQSQEFLLTYNYVRVMKLMAGVMQQAGPDGADLSFMAEAFDIPSSSNLIVCGGYEDGRASFTLLLPAQHMREMAEGFKRMQQQVRQQMQEQRRQTERPHTPPQRATPKGQ